MLPIMLMLLFVYLFGGAIRTGTEYVTYVVPGVLLLCAGYGASITAVSVSHDMSSGLVDRLRSLDVGGAAFLAGHVVASVARNAASTVVVLGVGPPAIGFRPDATPPEWVAAAGMLTLFVIRPVVVRGPRRPAGEDARGRERLHVLRDVPALPEQRVRPDRDDAGVIHGFAAHQPVTPVIETIRSLLLGTPAGTNPVQAVAWCSAILVASVALAGVLFRRRTA